MIKTYIGKLQKTGKIIESKCKLYDEYNNTYYLPNDLFEENKIKSTNSRTDLYKYKVYNNSIGESVTKDSDGKTIYTGDEVEIYYYEKNNSTKRFKIRATVIYDNKAQLYYMRTIDNQVFLFTGDTQHFISKIIRIGR